MDLVKTRRRTLPVTEVILAFVQSWEMHGSDETTLGSGALDILRAYLGRRPCCMWRKNGSALSKLSERGVVEFFFSNPHEKHQEYLNRAVVSGSSEFDPCNLSSITVESEENFDGFLHIPIRTQDEVVGVMALAVTKREARDRSFVEPLEVLGRLVAIALQDCQARELNTHRETRLRSEVEVTTKELELTNSRLIERVKQLKLLSQELEGKVKELTHANNTKNEFLSIVSHELRTPLTSLNGFLAVLLEEEAGTVNDQQKKFLGIAKQSADRLNLLIGDLLDISRIEAGRMNLALNSCSLEEIVGQSVKGLQSAADSKNIEIRRKIPPTLPSVWADADRIQQVVDNLLANAIKFTDLDGWVEIETEEKGDFIQLSVKDNGPGLAPDDQKKVFDMFHQVDATAKRKAGGVGLGLAIAHGIISLHGGQLWVESELGKGSTFKIILKRAAAPQSPSST